MLKMEIIQVQQRTRTLFLYSTKKLFNNFLSRSLSLILLFFLLSINPLSAKDIFLSELYCNTNNSELLDNTSNSINIKNSNFAKIISKINKDLSNKKFNLLISSGSKPSSGYKLEFNRSKIKKNKIYLYFNEIKPIKNSKNLMVITYPYCLLNINNLEEYKIKIKKN